jgi:CheY-like chemotaxis protein
MPSKLNAARPHKQTILVVDPEAELLAFTSGLLTESSYVVISCAQRHRGH